LKLHTPYLLSPVEDPAAFVAGRGEERIKTPALL